eukprot:TRINITY_DN2097_c0_g1_i1.p1 TRINITY_DN2097_c0_g1~~TRINITY_DN2097_c0_g1_i1.p1  ORF type:complete len:907 (+),score=213.43 TRINITY_DN2097_c0_g1_i1:56-2776(+)
MAEGVTSPDLRDLSPLDELAQILAKEHKVLNERAARNGCGSGTPPRLTPSPPPTDATGHDTGTVGTVDRSLTLPRVSSGDAGGEEDGVDATHDNVVGLYDAMRTEMSEERRDAFDDMLTTLNTVFIDGRKEVEGDNIKNNIAAMCSFFEGEKQRVTDWQRREAKINEKETTKRAQRLEGAEDAMLLRQARVSKPILAEKPCVPRRAPSVSVVDPMNDPASGASRVQNGRRRGRERVASLSDTGPLTRQKLTYMERAGLITSKTEELFTELLAAHAGGSGDCRDMLLQRFLPAAPEPAAKATNPRAMAALGLWKRPLKSATPRPDAPAGATACAVACPKCGHTSAAGTSTPQPPPLPAPAAAPRRAGDAPPDFTRGANKRKRRLGGDLELVNEEEQLHMDSFKEFLKSFATLDRGMWQSVRTIAVDESIAVEDCGSMLVELVIKDADSSWRKLYNKLGTYKRIEQDFKEVMMRYDGLRAENRRLEESNIIHQAFLSGDMARGMADEIMHLKEEGARLTQQVEDIGVQNASLLEERADRYSQVQVLEKQLADGQNLLKKLNMLAADTKECLAALITPEYAERVVPTMSEVDLLRRDILPDSGAPTSRRCPSCLMPNSLSPHCPVTGYPHTGYTLVNGLRDISDANIPLLELTTPLWSVVGAIAAQMATVQLLRRQSLLAEQGNFDDDISYGVSKRFVSIILQTLVLLLRTVKTQYERKDPSPAGFLMPSDNPLTFYDAYDDATCVQPFPQQYHSFRALLKTLCVYTGVNATNSSGGIKEVVLHLQEQRVVFIAVRAIARMSLLARQRAARIAVTATPPQRKPVAKGGKAGGHRGVVGGGVGSPLRSPLAAPSPVTLPKSPLIRPGQVTQQGKSPVPKHSTSGRQRRSSMGHVGRSQGVTKSTFNLGQT